MDAANDFLSTLRHGWREIAAFGDEESALVLYGLRLVDDRVIQVANHVLLVEELVARETAVFDSAQMKGNPPSAW